MDFRIADTFTDSLARLTGDEQKAVKTTAFDIQMKPATPVTNPSDHPDAQRRFRVMTNVEELERALSYPWEKWTVFLHPEQRQWVERDYTGPARVAGSAGTGKTIVALHRAAHLARTHPEARVLLTTFSDTLASALHTKLKRLVGSEPRLAERIDVYSLDAIALRLYKSHCGPAKLADREVILELLRTAGAAVAGHKFSLHFLFTEWDQIVDTWQLASWEAYRDVVSVLTWLAQRLDRTPATLRIWDPFYCVGNVVKRLASLGFHGVIHANRCL